MKPKTDDSTYGRNDVGAAEVDLSGDLVRHVGRASRVDARLEGGSVDAGGEKNGGERELHCVFSK